MNLSKHFTLDELTHTVHRKIWNDAPPEIVDRLRILVRDALEPIRDRFGPIRVTSGYRSPELNEAIGGARDSAHMYGCAADIQAIHGASPTDIVTWIVECSDIDYDQVIDEHMGRSRWVHIGMLRPDHEDEPRHQALSMFEGRYEVFHVKQKDEI